MWILKHRTVLTNMHRVPDMKKILKCSTAFFGLSLNPVSEN